MALLPNMENKFSPKKLQGCQPCLLPISPKKGKNRYVGHWILDDPDGWILVQSVCLHLLYQLVVYTL